MKFIDLRTGTQDAVAQKAAVDNVLSIKAPDMHTFARQLSGDNQ